MTMKISRVAFGFYLIAALSGIVLGQDRLRRDGKWWRDMADLESRLDGVDARAAYVLGLLDGTDLGHNFTVWGMMHSAPTKPGPGKIPVITDPAVGKANQSFNDFNSRYLSEVTVGQIKDGLDKFYEDYRNRKISLVDATWLVLCNIAGKPQAEWDGMVERYRKVAGVPGH